MKRFELERKDSKNKASENLKSDKIQIDFYSKLYKRKRKKT